MLNKKIILVLSFALLGIFILACNMQQPEKPASNGQVADYASFVDNLRASDAIVEPAGELSVSFFSAKGYAMQVNDEDVQVYEYNDESKANEEAKQVSADGTSVGTSSISWIGPPHFYKKGKIIVTYAGSNKEIIQLLEKLLGQQFAGAKIDEITCKNLCGDGICQEIVCMAIGCPCAETLESCPNDCGK